MGEVVTGDEEGNSGPVSDGIRTECDWTTTDPSVAIVEAIAAIEGTDPLDFSGNQGLVLQDHVDVDALDRLLGDDRRNVRDLTVEIGGYTVRITAEELLVVPTRDRPS